MLPAFEKFPDAIFYNFREQMLMGIAPADKVREILEPLLSSYSQIMRQLPLELQADFKNILKIYPDIAEDFEVQIDSQVEGA